MAEKSRFNTPIGRGKSTELIDEIVYNPLNPAYKEAYLAGSESAKFDIWIFLLMIVLGAIIAISTIEILNSYTPGTSSKLIVEIKNKSNSSAQISGELTGLNEQIQTLQNIQNRINSATDEIAQLSPFEDSNLVGPGIQIYINTANSKTIVLASDLRVIAQQLFQAGAEAVDINKIRLTQSTSISKGGKSLLVGNFHIESPFIISAIGDRVSLKDAMVRSVAGSTLSHFVETNSDVKISENNKIRVAKSTPVGLKYALDKK